MRISCSLLSAMCNSSCASVSPYIYTPPSRMPMLQIHPHPSPLSAAKPSSSMQPEHTLHTAAPCRDNRSGFLSLSIHTVFLWSEVRGVQRPSRRSLILFSLPPSSPPLSRCSPAELSLEHREDGGSEEGGGRRLREPARKRGVGRWRGGHGNGGLQRERSLSLPLFFVAVTGPQKQERVVHLQVAAVSSFIGWLWK